MNKLLLTLLLPFAAYTTDTIATDTIASDTASTNQLTPEAITSYQVSSVQANQTYTYVRCWYRPHFNHDDPATAWDWALDEKGDYFTLDGYWWSSLSFKNMFYTNASHKEITERCKATLGVDHETADMSYYAADNRMSYNHSIWFNDPAFQPGNINTMVTFGDSLSDAGNMFNASQWLFPNPSSWFLGRFSNGLVWTEYLARDKNIPLYNWAVGGAAGTNQYVALTGVTEQVTSYLTYMKMAQNYQPSRTLFTLEFGLNDFMNYNREVSEVKADFSSALVRLTDAGAQNIMLFTLPDATKAPQFKYSTQEEIEKVQAKIQLFNVYIRDQAQFYQDKGTNVTLVDAAQMFEELTSEPKAHGFENAKDACLNINRSSAMDYLYSHSLTNDCAYHGSDKYVFWGVTHPTTATHKYIADKILAGVINQYDF